MINNLYFNSIASLTGAVKLCNDDFVVSNIDGIRIGQLELATQTSTYGMGDTIVNQRLMPRDITVSLKPLKGKGDYTPIYEQFSKRLGKECYLIWKDRETADGTFTMFIKGVMTECELPMFEQNNEVTFTLHCETPLWEALANTVTFSGTSAAIVGDAPPKNITITVDDCTIPTGRSNVLYIGLCSFKSQSADVSGDVTLLLTDSFKSFRVDGNERLELINSPFNVTKLAEEGLLFCKSYINGVEQSYDISATYTPRWY